jgi:rhomboid family protein
MGIYDREYIRVGPRSSSGLGSLRFISFNSWIIILNVLVFVADLALSGYPVPVVVNEQPLLTMSRDAMNNLPRDARYEDPVYLDSFGSPLPVQVPLAFRDRAGNISLDPQGRTVRNPALRVGATAFQRVGDKRIPQFVGTQQVVFMTPVQAWGHLSTYFGIQRVEIWRYLTFQFLHANFTHLFFNMLGLWIFGGMVEQYLGSKRYGAFYLTCGIFGAVSYLLLNMLGLTLQRPVPMLLPDSKYTPLVGASAGVFGVIMACAYIAPNAIVQLLFPPIPMKLKWFAYGYVALAAANLLRGGANAGGDAAHLGGAIAGFFFVRNAHLLRDFFDIFGDSRRGRPAPLQAPDPVSDSELDRILGKVSRDGLTGLTEEEKRTLRQASERRRRA